MWCLMTWFQLTTESMIRLPDRVRLKAASFSPVASRLRTVSASLAGSLRAIWSSSGRCLGLKPRGGGRLNGGTSEVEAEATAAAA